MKARKNDVLANILANDIAAQVNFRCALAAGQDRFYAGNDLYDTKDACIIALERAEKETNRAIVEKLLRDQDVSVLQHQVDELQTRIIEQSRLIGTGTQGTLTTENERASHCLERSNRENTK